MEAFRRFRAGYRALGKAPETEESLDLVIFRPVAYLLVRAIERTPVTSNQISVLSMLFGVASGVLLGLATPFSMRWGAVGVLLFNVLDCADGMLARRRGTGSSLGYIVDGVCNYVASAAIVFGLGWGIATRHPHPLLWWTLTIAAGASLAWWCSVVDGMRLAWMCRVHGRRLDRVGELAELNETTERWRVERTHVPERLLVAAYRIYVRLWEGGPAQASSAAPEDGASDTAWASAHRPILRMALAGGSSMQLTVIVLAALLDRPELALWAALFVGNAWAAFVLLYRFTVRRRILARSLAGV